MFIKGKEKIEEKIMCVCAGVYLNVCVYECKHKYIESDEGNIVAET